ncbi:HAMP domain-containing protein [candidate division KSB1 bacterium]|nr:HAMP domain-containing protein [candidate division KSB1 bacterium]RQW02135.1 MAG: HAMP domain-containing protein [candidate division KSB1 bacterium]
MPIYVKWLLFILVFAFLFSIFLWFRTRKFSRFQARLALFFFLFVIIPLTPLTIFLGQLVLRSTETFIIPDVEHALRQSLDIFRTQLNDRGQCFLRVHPTLAQMTPDIMQRADILYIGEIVPHDSSYSLAHFVAQSHRSPHNPLASLSGAEIDHLVNQGQLIAGPDSSIFESFWQTDSSLLFAGFVAPKDVLDAKNSVTSALRNYATLGLLHETILEENLFWFIIFIFLLFIAVISVLLARLVSSGMSGPILKLTEGMRKIGAGDLNHRVDVKAKDEVAYLIDSFNRMAEELKVSRENLQRAERAAAWRDIARQVSHEIKNPLTPIEFSIYRLESSLPSELSGNKDFIESLNIIKQEITAIRRIADTFSKFAKMPHAELKTMDISAIVRASVELFRNDSSGVSIQFQPPKDLPDIPVDEQQIRGVMHNLIKNAIEASEAGGVVRVTAGRHSGSTHGLKIEVTDEGCGMDEDTIKRIFDPYFTTKQAGSGIGLFLAQRIISDHGGHIQVKSEPGVGTTFSIVL